MKILVIGQTVKVISPDCPLIAAENGRVGTITGKVGNKLVITFPYSGDKAVVGHHECELVSVKVREVGN